MQKEAQFSGTAGTKTESGGGSGAIIAVVGVLVVLGGVGGAAFFLSKKKPDGQTGDSQAPANANMQGTTA